MIDLESYASLDRVPISQAIEIASNLNEVGRFAVHLTDPNTLSQAFAGFEYRMTDRFGVDRSLEDPELPLATFPIGTNWDNIIAKYKVIQSTRPAEGFVVVDLTETNASIDGILPLTIQGKSDLVVRGLFVYTTKIMSGKRRLGRNKVSKAKAIIPNPFIEKPSEDEKEKTEPENVAHHTFSAKTVARNAIRSGRLGISRKF